MCPECGGAGVTSEGSGVTSSVIGARSLTQLLGLALLTLRFHAPSLRAARRTRGASGFLRCERGPDSTGQSLFGDLSIAELGSFIVDHDTNQGAEVVEQRLSLLFGHDGRFFEVPGKLDSCGGLVCVLPTGTAGRAESFGQFHVGNDERRLHGDGHGIECRESTGPRRGG